MDRIYKKDPMRMTNHFYGEMEALEDTKRGLNEYFSNFESRISAQLSQLHVLLSGILIAEILSALLLVRN